MNRSTLYTVALGLIVVLGTAFIAASLSHGVHFREGENWFNPEHCIYCGESLGDEIAGIKVCTECGERFVISNVKPSNGK
jgi:hypothetical protein